MEPNPKRPYLHYFILGIRPLPPANRQYDGAISVDAFSGVGALRGSVIRP